MIFSHLPCAKFDKFIDVNASIIAKCEDAADTTRIGAWCIHADHDLTVAAVGLINV
jgi:hypothetical protein